MKEQYKGWTVEVSHETNEAHHLFGRMRVKVSCPVYWFSTILEGWPLEQRTFKNSAEGIELGKRAVDFIMSDVFLDVPSYEDLVAILEHMDDSRTLPHNTTVERAWIVDGVPYFSAKEAAERITNKYAYIRQLHEQAIEATKEK